MMQPISQFKKETMRRIYLVFFMRKLVGRIALKTYAVLGLLYLQTYAVSFTNVIKNMPALSDLPAVARFYSYAFLNTQASVQLMTVAVLALALWLSRDLARDMFRPERNFR